MLAGSFSPAWSQGMWSIHFHGLFQNQSTVGVGWKGILKYFAALCFQELLNPRRNEVGAISQHFITYFTVFCLFKTTTTARIAKYMAGIV